MHALTLDGDHFDRFLLRADLLRRLEALGFPNVVVSAGRLRVPADRWPTFVDALGPEGLIEIAKALRMIERTRGGAVRP